MIEDLCKFFAGIEAAPEAIVSGITVRDYLLLREHLVTCDKCFEIAERISSQFKPQTFMDIMGEN